MKSRIDEKIGLDLQVDSGDSFENLWQDPTFLEDFLNLLADDADVFLLAFEADPSFSDVAKFLSENRTYEKFVETFNGKNFDSEKTKELFFTTWQRNLDDVTSEYQDLFDAILNFAVERSMPNMEKLTKIVLEILEPLIVEDLIGTLDEKILPIQIFERTSMVVSLITARKLGPTINAMKDEENFRKIHDELFQSNSFNLKPAVMEILLTPLENRMEILIKEVVG